MDIAFYVTGDTLIIDNFDKYAGKTENMSPAFQRIADQLSTSTKANFNSQGGRFGTRWASRKQAYPWPILQKTGRLSKSFKTSYTNKSASITNNASYAKYHQLGTRKLPVRGILGWNTSDISAVTRIIRKHVGF